MQTVAGSKFHVAFDESRSDGSEVIHVLVMLNLKMAANTFCQQM